jgi:hypothetical protein
MILIFDVFSKLKILISKANIWTIHFPIIIKNLFLVCGFESSQAFFLKNCENNVHLHGGKKALGFWIWKNDKFTKCF